MPEGALQRFAQEVAAMRGLREAAMPERVGAFVPTCHRPDLLRACVLQLLAQSRRPDVICVHQGGDDASYQWAVEDLDTGATKIVWLHTAGLLSRHAWYAIPLQNLVEKQCTHYFWIEQDALYLRQHIEAGMQQLAAHDFSASRRCGLLHTHAADHRYGADADFASHPAGGWIGSSCFRREFARQLLADIRGDTSDDTTESVLARKTLPRFRGAVGTRRICIHHAHESALAPDEWLKKIYEP